jgi:hypothetical protein
MVLLLRAPSLPSALGGSAAESYSIHHCTSHSWLSVVLLLRAHPSAFTSPSLSLVSVFGSTVERCDHILDTLVPPATLQALLAFLLRHCLTVAGRGFHKDYLMISTLACVYRNMIFGPCAPAHSFSMHWFGPRSSVHLFPLITSPVEFGHAFSEMPGLRGLESTQ